MLSVSRLELWEVEQVCCEPVSWEHSVLPPDKHGKLEKIHRMRRFHGAKTQGYCGTRWHLHQIKTRIEWRGNMDSNPAKTEAILVPATYELPARECSDERCALVRARRGRDNPQSR